MSPSTSTSLPTTMKQIHFEGAGGPEVIRVGDAPVPSPGPGKVLVEVVAAGVNRPDVIQRSGGYPPPPGESEIPGLEISGRIVALGEGVTGLSLGAEVCALVGSGGYAEYALADAALCLPVPKTVSPASTPRGLPETFFTVYDNVFLRGGLKAGENSWSMAARAASARQPSSLPCLRSGSLHDGGIGREMRVLPRARRRSCYQLQDPRFRRRDQKITKKTGVNRHPRHGRRHLSRKEHLDHGDWKAGSCRSPFCTSGIIDNLDFSQCDDAASDAHGFDLAVAPARAESRHRRGVAGKIWPCSTRARSCRSSTRHSRWRRAPGA